MPDATGSQHPTSYNEDRQWSLRKGRDTVGQPPSAAMCVSDMPSWKAKKLRKLSQAKVLLER